MRVIGDNPLATNLEFKAGDRGREHLVLLRDVFRTDDAAQQDRLCLLAEFHLSGRLYDEHPVRQHLDHLASERRAQAGVRRAGALGVESRRRVLIYKVLEGASGMQRSEEVRDLRTRIRCS